MGLTIDLPTAGLLGIAGAQAFEITANTSLLENSIYVLKQAGAFTITLPTTITIDGGTILVKKVGTQTVTVASALIEGTVQSLTITNNQPIRFLYINATFGWLIS
jgi:2-keto-3-deoxy-6-phosphogluconate aldolase|tara:strand:- start:30 stop:344 length:315 start_codon:yes stop_codon:yes gene_type:complete